MAAIERPKPGLRARKHAGRAGGAAGRLPDPGDRRTDRERHARGDAGLPGEELHRDLTGLQQKVSLLSLCFHAKNTHFIMSGLKSRPGAHRP